METNFDIYNKNIKHINEAIKFTKGQNEAINGLIEFINSPYIKGKSINGLVGPGGVGKTFVIKYIINKCNLSNSAILCASPTHKACRVFGTAINSKVLTIQSVFGFRLSVNIDNFDYKNPNFAPIMKPKLDGIKVLIIDESSMLNASLVTYINNECDSREIKIIYVGDASQLSPVKERKSTAFTICNKVYILDEVVRQNDSNPILDLANLIRKDIENNTRKSIEFISKNKDKSFYNENGEGFCICSESKFIDTIKTKFHDEEYTRNIDKYKIIAYTNDKVALWNNFIRNEIIKDADKNIITTNDLIMSYQTIVDDFNAPIINNSEEYIIKDMVNYVDDKYGFKGFLIKFQLVNGGTITKPLFVLDHTDRFTIMLYVKTVKQLITDAKSANGATRSKKWKEYFEFKQKYLIAVNIKSNNETLYTRDIDYAFALTAHKAQGSTYTNVFVDANDIIYTKQGFLYPNTDEVLRRLYVAISRAKQEIIISYGR